ncbi:LytR/AlgR family response regulator transcription factor [Mucilaginibacter pineti]|uniref:LytR/AlgR family response regulator transcription factor n=1 Tax=Mucilaginibacter pineti TaxID=1391627 RepID=UPI0013BEAA43|nr:LytTR family DNA-binding domain-containing protein [Mucilaginibacter pineti]
MNREPAALGLLSQHVGKTSGLKLIGCNSDPLDAVAKIGRSEVIPDMVFLDSEVLRGSNMLKVRSALLDRDTQVVFSSLDNDLAAAAFDWDAVDYLQQPVSYERFLRCINKVKERFGLINQVIERANASCFFIQSDGKGKLIRVAKERIVYVESALNYLHIHLDTSSHATYLPIKEMEENLSGGPFIRVHKSFIINLDKINVVEGNMIHLNNGKTIVLGPNYRKDFFERIGSLVMKSKK